MAKRISLLGLFLALSLGLSYLEHLVPLPLPGVKLGLSNLIVLLSLYAFDGKTAALLLGAKILLSSLLFAGFSALIYSLCGGILSFAVMYLLKRAPCFSIIGVSMGGGVAHNIGQLLGALLFFPLRTLFFYLPWLLLSGLLAGALLGILAALLQTRSAFRHLL